MTTLKQVSDIFNSGKSLPAKKSVSILNSKGFNATIENYKGYRSVKPQGQRYVTSRKEVKFWRVSVCGKTFSNETSTTAAYSLTCFVLDKLKNN